MFSSRFKVAILMLLAIALLLGATSAVSAAPWSDIDDGILGPYGVTVGQLSQVSSGYPDGTWHPWLGITRGQFAKMAVTAFGLAPVIPESPTFSDVAPTDTFYAHIEGAYSAGLMQGVGEGRFDAGSAVTREQAIAVVARKVAADQGYDLAAMTEAEIGAALAGFADGAMVSPSLRDEVAFALKQGLVKGNASGELSPKAPMSRIAAAVVLVRATAPRPLVLDVNDNGRTVRVRVGDTIAVVLKGNPTTGYKWTAVLSAEDAATLEQVGEPAYVADSDMIGAGGTFTFTFRAMAAGEVTLKLEYTRSFESEPALETFSVTVQVDNAPVQSADVVLGEEDDGSSVTVKVGDIIEVVLKGNPTTGYGWQANLTADDAAVLEQVGEPVYVPESGLIGAGGTYYFNFRAIAVGEAALTLHYSRPWESVPPLESFSVTVKVEAAGAGGAAALLDGTAWRLQGWPISSLYPLDFEITARFEDGRISGKSAVNWYGGSYTADASGTFSVGTIVQTLMAGPGPAMLAETTYFGLLQQARSHVLAGDTLTLVGEGGGELLIFAPEVED